MAKKCGIPHTTLFGWLKYNEIKEDQYQDLIRKGVTKTQITNSLKSKKTTENIVKVSATEIMIEEIQRIKYKILDLNKQLNINNVNKKMFDETQKLQETLNKFSLKLYKNLHPK